jgi:nucleoside-triphosphatase THEP1
MPTHVRHVFLTGFPGVGKTTTMLKAIDELGKAADALPPCGFYTAELRDVDGKRCGFDVVTFPSGQSDARRAPLARLVAGDGVGSARPRHRVGRYAVDVKALETTACPALRHGDVISEGQKTMRRRRFVALDEIGKMECLSSEFERAAWEALESPETVVLGTIPVHRQSLARSVAARPDVAVVRVTEHNRDALRAALVDAMKHSFANDRERERDHEATVPLAPLAPFLETGQSSKFGLERTEEEEEREKEEEEEKALSKDEQENVQNADALVVGGDAHRRLFGDSDEPFPPPRTLLLGETSSPAPPPTRPELAYAERSMWRVLDEVLAEETDETKQKEKGTTTTTNRETTRLLAVFRAGLAVWDVVADVHVPGERKNKHKTKTKDGASLNDVFGFLRLYPSVTRLVFVGERAWRRFRSAPGNGNATRESKSSDETRLRVIAVDGRTVDAFVVRSARGDERDRREKVREWSEALFGGDAARTRE